MTSKDDLEEALHEAHMEILAHVGEAASLPEGRL